jgi:hypothetical protein
MALPRRALDPGVADVNFLKGELSRRRLIFRDVVDGVALKCESCLLVIGLYCSLASCSDKKAGEPYGFVLRERVLVSVVVGHTCWTMRRADDEPAHVRARHAARFAPSGLDRFHGMLAEVDRDQWPIREQTAGIRDGTLSQPSHALQAQSARFPKKVRRDVPASSLPSPSFAA